MPPLSVARRITSKVTLDGKTYDNVVLLAAPFESQDVVANPQVLMQKLSSGIDDLIEEDLANNPDFIFCTALKPEDVPDAAFVFHHCEYKPTDNTIIVVRAFGLNGEIDEEGKVPDDKLDYIHHLSCQVTFVENRVLFMTKGNASDEERRSQAN